MRQIILFVCITLILAVSCRPIASVTPPDETPDRFTDPDPGTYVSLLPAVLEYFYYRKMAFISGDAEQLWARYPALKNDPDIPKGINAEAFTISNYRGLKPFDGNISPEAYERMRVRQAGNETRVLVHGTELYLFQDRNGIFSESGGEFKIVLSLQWKVDRWIVIKTDEVTQGEWDGFSP